jgi:hypothetical protein
MSSALIYIVIIIIIFLFLYGIFYYYYLAPSQSNVNKYKIPLITNETIFTEDYSNILNMETLVTRDTLYVPKLGYGLTFSWEMYIPSQNGNDKWQTSFNHLKPIITMSDSPIISYHPKKNYLSITVKYRNNPFYAQFSEVKFENMKLQKWSKYTLVIENRNIRLYIDGILVSTKILPSVIAISDIKSEITLGQLNNNFLGKIKNLSLFPYPLSYDEVLSI